jgi:hypothetical protein
MTALVLVPSATTCAPVRVATSIIPSSPPAFFPTSCARTSASASTNRPSASGFKTSTVYSTNQGSVDMSARSSSCSYFKRGENDLIKSIESQVASLLSIDLKQIEPLQIVRYEKGQQYKYHYDYFGKETDQKKNQRLHSILVYLNDLDEVDGGSTHFPLLKIRTYPYKGRAVLWNNLSADGTENNLTLHAGEPVLNDKIKYVLTIWTRVSEY